MLSEADEEMVNPSKIILPFTHVALSPRLIIIVVRNAVFKLADSVPRPLLAMNIEEFFST